MQILIVLRYKVKPESLFQNHNVKDGSQSLGRCFTITMYKLSKTDTTYEHDIAKLLQGGVLSHG